MIRNDFNHQIYIMSDNFYELHYKEIMQEYGIYEKTLRKLLMIGEMISVFVKYKLISCKYNLGDYEKLGKYMNIEIDNTRLYIHNEVGSYRILLDHDKIK